MDTRFLESFLIVVESGSVAEAARRLDLTPAALAQRIRTLEEEMGIRLVVREGRTTRPTEAGRAILKQARQILADAQELRLIATGESLSGKLRIGAISTSVTGILPIVLKFLATSAPQIDVYVVPGTSTMLYQNLLNGEIDAAILVQPPFELFKTCDWMLLREEPLIAISPGSIPIQNPKTLFTAEPFIRYDRNHWGGRLVDGYLRQAKIFPRERFELDALEAIVVLVSSGLGVSLIPDWSAPWPEGLTLNKLRIDAPAFARRVGLLWMRNSPNIRLVQSFRAQMLDALGMLKQRPR